MILSRLDHPLKERLVKLPCKSGIKPIALAARKGRDAGIFQLLLDSGANMGDVLQDGHVVFHVACGCSEAVFQTFLNAASDDDMFRVSKDENEYSILHYAILMAGTNIRAVRMVLNHIRIHPNAAPLLDLPSRQGLTPTMLAATMGLDGVLQLLLSAGANVRVVNPDTGHRALLSACMNQHWSSCHLLLDHEIKLLEDRDHRNFTLLLSILQFGGQF